MVLKSLVAACAVLLGGSALAATCDRTSSLGNTSTESWFIDAFSSTGSFNDCYTFSLGSAASASGWLAELDFGSRLDIDVASVSLFSGMTQLGTDTNGGSFNFGSIAAGNYTLAVAGDVSRGRWGNASNVGYLGSFQTVAAPVPEPETYAMLLAGFIGVGVVARRRKTA